MKKYLLFFLVLMMALPTMAQEAKSRPHHGGPHEKKTLSIVAPRGQSFWLYVDDVLQNRNPVHSICIDNLKNDHYYVLVELDNELRNTVGQIIDLNESNAFTILHNKRCWGIVDYHVQIRPEVTIDLVTNQPHWGYNNQNPTPHMQPVQHMQLGMNPQDYEHACQLIANESFDSSRMTIAEQVVTSNPMTASQILGICKLFTYEDNKLEFAKFAYTRCVDQNNYYLLNEAFTFDSSKQELHEYIKL